jgi:hypothetical protein
MIFGGLDAGGGLNFPITLRLGKLRDKNNIMDRSMFIFSNQQPV